MNTIVEGHQSVGGAASRGKPDPNVVPPTQVRKAAERAEELSRQAAAARAANPDGQKPVNVQLPPPPGNVGAVVTNFDPNNPNPPTEAQLLAAQNAPPQPQPPPQPQVTPQGDPQPPSTPEDWEHRFNSLKGRYDREAENNKRMARQIADMQHLMATVATAPPAPAQSQGSGVRFEGPITGTGRYVTPKEITEFGEETIDVMGRRAREVVEPLVGQLINEVQALRAQVGGVRNSQAYDASVRMYDDLKREVPNWNEINNSPEFSRWLDQPDPMTGVVRRDILGYAHGRNQTGQVVAVFKGFMNDQASYGPAYQRALPGNGAGTYPQLTAGGNGAASTPQNALMQYAAPGRAKSGLTEVPPEKPIFNATDITQFYRDKTAGRYAGREAEADQLERALFDASREGRVRR